MSFALRSATAALALLLFASAIAVVWSKHEARSAFITLQSLHAERDALDIEWGQLKLEQSAWATHGRVEQTARVGLRMVIPRPEEVRIVKPDAPKPAASRPEPAKP
jgi:cell division protein FtsL